MTNLEKWKEELIKVKYKQIKEIEEISLEKAVTLFETGLDCSKCIYHSEDECENVRLSNKCKLEQNMGTCREGIKAYLDMEVE